MSELFLTHSLGSKADMRALVAKGELREALSAAIRYAEYCSAAETLNQLSALSAQLEQHIALWAGGQSAYEDFSRGQARVAHHLLEWIDRLPNQPQPGAGKKKLLEEETVQRHLLLLLLAGKGFVLGWVWWRWTQTGAFNTERAMTLFAMLAPAFVATAYAMLDYYLQRHHKNAPASRRVVSGPLVAIAYGMFPLYAIIMWYVLQMGVIYREWAFATMCAVMSGLESVFAGLSAKIVSAFFQRQE